MNLFRRSLIIVFLVLSSSAVNLLFAQKQKHNSPRVIVKGKLATIITVAPKPLMLPPEAQRRYDTFVKVWQTIQDNYFDPTFSNLNWDNIRTEYEPLVKAASSDSDLHRILNNMIGRLNRSHLAVIPPEVYQVIEQAKIEAKTKEKQAAEKLLASSGDEKPDDQKNVIEDDPATRYGIGIELSLINDRFVITRNEPNSAAEYAGLKPGYIIDKINGVSLVEMLNRIQIYNSAIRNTNIKQFIPAVITIWMLNGEKDTYVNISYLNENEESKEIRIRREPLKEKSIPILANFPDQQLSFETRSLNDSTAYIRFNFFAVPVIERFCKAIGEIKSNQALVIDLRGNTGGLLASISTLAGMLTTNSFDFGTSIYRYRTEQLSALSKAKNFKGRIVILIDERTASAAEIFALALRENGRALLVGQQTAGQALPSVTVNLPTGAVLLYPFANYKSVGGKFIEGSGVEPDLKVILDRKALLEGKDLQLEAAIKLAGDQAAFSALRPKEKELNASTNNESDNPPPPPPLTKKPSEKLETPPDIKLTRNFKMAAPVTKKSDFVPGHDAPSQKYINDFLTTIGGKEKLMAISKYSLAGTANINIYGSSNLFTFNAFLEKPDKYSELLYLVSSGEIRDIIDGKKNYIQTDLGIDQELSVLSDASQVNVLAPIFEMAAAQEMFTSLKFTGVFDREGQKTAILEGKTKKGTDVALAFDIETKMLVNISYTYTSLSFGEYKKVGDLTLPFNIKRGSSMAIKLDSINLNTAIDPANFKKKENCYDRPD